MATKTKAELSVPESKRLAECESTIQSGRQTFMEVGKALLEIKTGKLYRASHKTFEQYTEARWGWGASRARQIINAVQIQKSVTKVTLLGERSARALADVPKEKRQEVVEKAAVNGQATEARIREAVAEVVDEPKKLPKAPERPSKAPPRPEKPKDEAGRPIDPKAADALARTQEFKDLERDVHEIKRRVLALASEDIGHHLDGGHLGRLFKEICTAISFARPWTACPMNTSCSKTCKCCRGQNWVNKDIWENVPKEFKK